MAKLNFKKIQGRLYSAAGLVAGSVAGNYAKNTINNLSKGKVTPLANAGIRVLVAAALPSVVGSSKAGGFLTDFSNGMMAQAGVDAAVAMKIPGISGTDVDQPVGNYSVEGTSVETPVSGVSN